MNDSLDCLQAYKEYLIEREMSENTIEKYLRDVRAFVRYMGGRELERAEVLRYKKELLAQYKITSANSMLTALNHFFKWLGRNELCMKTCRQQRQIFRDAEKDLTREEYRRLLQTAGREGKERLRCLLQAIAGTGMRIGELSCLTVEALKKRTRQRLLPLMEGAVAARRLKEAREASASCHAPLTPPTAHPTGR